MKSFFILIVSLSIPLIAFGQADSLARPDDSVGRGFTNKAEAKNLTVNGVREGKWLRYLDSDWYETTDTNAPFYTLYIYKAGQAIGMIREYYKSGRIAEETLLKYTSSFDKEYYENGKLKRERYYVNGKENGASKTYFENGKLKSKVTYSNDTVMSTINYDENGNEIK
jgi:antitoxin component YwqK of YwqJK toxin-antitoxin module